MQHDGADPALDAAKTAISPRIATRALRVAMVAPGLDILGGQGVQAESLRTALRDDGVQVSFIPINPRFPVGLGWIRRIRFVRTALNEFLYLISLLRVRNADLVHLFSASYWSFLLAQVPAIVIARAFGVPVLLNYHSGEADDHLTRWGRSLHGWLRKVDAIVVPSQYLQQVFQRHGYQASVVPNVVDLQAFSFRERNPLRPRLLSVRNLESLYRVDNTLEAFARIRAVYPQATLVIAGVGTQESRLRQWVRRQGLEGVTFRGRIEPADMPALHREADIFLNSSVVDNQPVSILEAFASGLPVVTTPTGDIPFLVQDGETGLLVPPGDPAAMAQAVFRLLQEPGLAQRLIGNAHDSVDRFTWPQVRSAWLRLYNREAL